VPDETRASAAERAKLKADLAAIVVRMFPKKLELGWWFGDE